MRISFATKDTEILLLKMRNQQLSNKEPGVAEALRAENAKLKIKVIALTKEVQGFNSEVKYLTK